MAGLYTAFGKVIESDLRLPHLPSTRRGEPCLKIRRHQDNGLARGGGQPVYQLVNSAGDVLIHLELRDGRYLWWHSDVARFAVARSGRLIRWAAADAKRPDVAAVLAGPVLGFALQLQGQTTLHGSAVVIGGRAVGLLGPSGHGKSTTAAVLMTRGCQLLTDGVIVLDVRSGSMRVLPSYPSVKLSPDGLERFLSHVDWRAFPRQVSWLEKRVVSAADLGSVCRSARPLAALFLLSPAGSDSEIEVKPLRAREALLALVANGYNARLLSLEREFQARQLEVFSRIVQTTPVYAIRCPRTLERIDEVANAMLAHSWPT